MHAPYALVTAFAALLSAGGPAEPPQVAEELRKALVALGPVRVTYDVTIPGRDQPLPLEVTADFPWACALVSGTPPDCVRAYSDARGRLLYMLTRQGERTTLLRTDATPLLEAVHAVRQAFVKAGLVDEASLPHVTSTSAPATDQGLSLFARLTLGLTRDEKRQPHIQSGVGLTVGTIPRCGNWLHTITEVQNVKVAATEGLYGLSDRQGTELRLDRKTGLPALMRVSNPAGQEMTLTLKRVDRLTAFEPPAWVRQPEPGIELRIASLPREQVAAAGHTAWSFYAGRSIQRLAGQPNWRDQLNRQRPAIVQALTAAAVPLWENRGAGLDQGFVTVLTGALAEARRRFPYVKEPDPVKARAVARQYAEEAIERRAEIVDQAIERVLEQFGRDVLTRIASATDQNETPVLAELLVVVRAAVRTSYVNQAADTIANDLMASRPKP